MMRKLVSSVPFAVVVGLVLVASGSVIATAPATADLWISKAVAAVAMFGAIVYVGAVLSHRGRDRR